MDAYVSDLLLKRVLDGETPNLDHLLTPERIAEIEKGEAEIAAGNFFTADQVREHFREKRAAWQKAHA